MNARFLEQVKKLVNVDLTNVWNDFDFKNLW